MSFSLEGSLSLDASKFLKAVDQVKKKLGQVGDDAKNMPDADVSIDAKDTATDDLKKVSKKVDEVDGDTATVKVDTAGTEAAMEKLGALTSKLPGPIQSAVGHLGAIPGPAGVAAGAVAALVGGGALLATNFARAATAVADLADLTGDSLDTTSRLVSVWEDTGGETEDLRAILISMNSALQDNTELAGQLGVDMDDGKGAAARFEQVVKGLGERFTDAGERGRVASELFGEDDQARVSRMLSRVDDLGAALEGIDEARIITEDDVQAAREMDAAFAAIRVGVGGIGNAIGRAFLPLVAEVATVLASWAEKIPKRALADFGRALADVFGALMSMLDPGMSMLLAAFGAGLGVVADVAGVLAGAAQWLSDAWGTALAWIIDKIADMVGAVAGATGWIPGLGGKVKDTANALREMADEAGDAADATDDVSDAADDGADATDDLADASQALAERQAEMNAEAEAAADQLRDLAAALDEQVKAMRSAADATFAVRDAERALEDQAATTMQVLEDSTASETARAVALDDVSEAAIRLADATVRQRNEQAAANGATISGAAQLDIFNGRLLAQAGTLRGPARSAVLDYIGNLNGIPAAKLTEIQALVDAGDIAGAERVLAQVSRARATEIRADAATAAAAGDLNRLAAGRGTTVTARANSTAAQRELDRLATNRSTTLSVTLKPVGESLQLMKGMLQARMIMGGGMADGGVAAGGVTLVGEEGPELVMMPKGAYVHTAPETARMLAGGGRPLSPIPGTMSPSAGARGAGSTSSTVVEVRQLFGDITVNTPADLDRMLADADRMVAGWAGR